MNENKAFSQIFLTLCASVGLLALSATAIADVAGKVISTSGPVQAIDAAGQSRKLQRNDPVSAGDTLATGTGRAQVSFTDGGTVALKPGTRFRIDEYNYAGVDDGSERSFFSLLKGGFRAISGTIGHKNPQTYRVQSTVATIGIRGTTYDAQLCAGDCEDLDDGLHVKTDEGTINVYNDVGALDVPSGKSAYVKDANTPPVFEDDGGGAADLTENPLNDPYYRAGEQQLDLPSLPSPSGSPGIPGPTGSPGSPTRSDTFTP